MTLNLDGYNTASTVMHSAQGAALLALGLTEAYAARKPGGRLLFVSPLVFLLSGAAMLLAILYFIGGWSVKTTLFSLQLKSGFYIFPSFACFYAAAGLSQFNAFSSQWKRRGWNYLFLAFLTVIGLLYFGMSRKVNPEAATAVAAYHSAIGFTLLAAVMCKILHEVRPRAAFNLAWIILLFISSYQLLSYREVAGAFDLGAAPMRVSPMIDQPAAAVSGVKIRTFSQGQSGGASKDAKTTDQKRAGN
jgi:hypothetical protein